jgi:hypothetical protein
MTKTHGETSNYKRTAEYEAWRSMNKRCSNRNHRFFNRYGGRGITVCSRWLHSFEMFLADMGRKPLGTSLERRNNDGNYEPSNCYWATAKEQNRNRRTNVNIEIDGRTMCASDWAKEAGLSHTTVLRRLRAGFVGRDIVKPTPRVAQR